MKHQNKHQHNSHTNFKYVSPKMVACHWRSRDLQWIMWQELW